ncbi:hypothetical protein NKI23_32905 [Mesorhizobium sp. M0809]
MEEIVEGAFDQTAGRFGSVTVIPILLPSSGPDLRQPSIRLECLEAAIADNSSIFIALKSKLEPSRIAWIAQRVDSRNAHPSSSVQVSQL